MLNIHRILHATDSSSSSEHALVHALHLAREHDAELHMLHAVLLHSENPHDPAHHFPDLGDLDNRLRQAAADRMADLLEAHDVPEDHVVRVRMRGIAAAPVILEYAQGEDVDLIVVGTHGYRGLSRLMLGSVAEEVIRLAQCPVLAIRGHKRRSVIRPFRTILAPLDLSHHSKTVLEHAADLATLYGAKLSLMHVVDDAAVRAPSPITEPDVISPEDPAIRSARRHCLRIMEEVGGGAEDADVEVLTGHAVSTITKFARARGIDLITLASHGEGALESNLIGSVAGGVISHAPCSVLVVKPFGRTLTSQT